MAKEMDVPFLGKIPIEKDIVEAGDSGTPFIEAYLNSQTAKEINNVINKIIKEEK